MWTKIYTDLYNSENDDYNREPHIHNSDLLWQYWQNEVNEEAIKYLIQFIHLIVGSWKQKIMLHPNVNRRRGEEYSI